MTQWPGSSESDSGCHPSHILILHLDRSVDGWRSYEGLKEGGSNHTRRCRCSHSLGDPVDRGGVRAKAGEPRTALIRPRACQPLPERPLHRLFRPTSPGATMCTSRRCRRRSANGRSRPTADDVSTDFRSGTRSVSSTAAAFGRRTTVSPSLATTRDRVDSQGNAGLLGSVRDRGVGGSNPLAPTNFLRKFTEFSLLDHSDPPE